MTITPPPGLTSLFSKVYLPRIESRALKYGYSNARVRGMKGLLLKPSFLEEMIKVSSVDAMIELLRRTHYKGEFDRLSATYRGSVLIELGTARHFFNSVRHVKKFVPKDDLKIVDALLKRWDILNLKILLNARRAGKGFAEVKPFMLFVGNMSEQDFERIADTPDDELLEVVKRTEVGRALFAEKMGAISRHSVEIFKNAMKSTDSFLQLQVLLDSFMHKFIEKSLSINNPDVIRIRETFKKEVDAKNAMIIMRLKAKNFDESRISGYLIPGGTFNSRIISSLLEAKTFESFFNTLKFRFRSLEEIPKSHHNLEILLEKALAYEKVQAFHRSILSIGVVLGLLLLKEEELNNIRKIAKAKEFNIPENEIREMLVTT